MTTQSEDLTRYRATMLLIAVGLGTPLIAFEVALGHRWPWKSLWLASCGVAALWLRRRKTAPPRVVQQALAAVMCALGPLSIALSPHTFVELATIGAMPIIVAVLFIERFDVVVAVSISGWLANTFLFWLAGWSLADVASVSARLAAGALVVSFSSWFNQRRRRLQRRLEAESQATLRASEMRRAQAERLAMMGRLSAGVAHEINNPLAVVSSNVNAMEAHVRDTDRLPPNELDEVLNDTRSSIERMKQIVADLKTWSRDDSDAIEPVDLPELIASTVRLARLRLPRDVKVVIDAPPALPRVAAHPRKLGQALLNLLINAADAIHDARTEQPQIELLAQLADDGVRVTVRDNGPGLSAEAREHLFEPFFTTKPPGKGTGLGLALSKEYVESFGGRLELEPVAQGTSFALSLKTNAAVTP